jgi:hypothetical protein
MMHALSKIMDDFLEKVCNFKNVNFSTIFYFFFRKIVIASQRRHF